VSFLSNHQGMHIGQPFRNVTEILAGTPMYTAQTEVERLSGLFEDRS
jgi:circadian clock protein KaiC